MAAFSRTIRRKADELLDGRFSGSRYFSVTVAD